MSLRWVGITIFVLRLKKEPSLLLLQLKENCHTLSGPLLPTLWKLMGTGNTPAIIYWPQALTVIQSQIQWKMEMMMNKDLTGSITFRKMGGCWKKNLTNLHSQLIPCVPTHMSHHLANSRDTNTLNSIPLQ